MLVRQNQEVAAIILHEINMTYAVKGPWVKEPYLLCDKIVLEHESDGEQIGFTYTKEGETYIVLHNGGYTVVAKA